MLLTQITTYEINLTQEVLCIGNNTCQSQPQLGAGISITASCI